MGFKDAAPELAGELADKYTDLYIEEKLGGFEEKSPRFVFLQGTKTAADVTARADYEFETVIVENINDAYALLAGIFVNK